jgi:hypothetical protein
MEITRNGLLVVLGCAAVVAVTALIVVPVLTGGDIGGMSASCDVGQTERRVIASVGDEVLTEEDLLLMGMDTRHVEAWMDDELLAQLAVELELENPRVSRFVEKRARQVYLRDLMMARICLGVDYPTDAEALAFMHTDSMLYLVERHYFHILLADSALADSVHDRLQRGDTFETTAQRLSIGQKAGLGGDLGFLVGGELTAMGLPADAGLLDGLGPVYRSDLGWHIFMVSETRPLTDTTRVVESVSGVLYDMLIAQRVDSILADARMRIPCQVDSSWR